MVKPKTKKPKPMEIINFYELDDVKAFKKSTCILNILHD